jgi:hypothetical protein
MIQQSTRHILMVEPAEFFANPQTMSTNVYQVEQDDEDKSATFQSALQEFRAFRDLLVEHGVMVTTVQGRKGCPAMGFPNWAPPHDSGRMVLYPMLGENRRAERDPDIIEMLKKSYPNVIDLTAHESKGLFLEARGSIVADRVNKMGYLALSARTSLELAEKWASIMDYHLEVFDTLSHTGKPVYHTDLVMHIGTNYAGVCAEAIVERDRARVLDNINQTHDVVEFTMEQMKSFCGNALEVLGTDNKPYLAMSSAAHDSLTEEQRTKINSHFEKILHSPLPTLEKYGGGSARCTLMELY